MPLYSTFHTLKLLADAIDAEEDKIEICLNPDFRERMSKQLEWLQARFSAEYSRFMAAGAEMEAA
jgi:hypothetical protein